MGEEDRILVEGLRAGEESAFEELVELHHAAITRLAMSYVSSRAVAEEVAQDVWLSVLEGIGRFEGRSSLRTWLFRIVVNQAKSRGQRERRIVPYGSLTGSAENEGLDGLPQEAVIEWEATAEPPDRELWAKGVRLALRDAIREMPPNQRAVLVLRDVLGWEPEEVGESLGIGYGNQRVLLHRARLRAREALRDHLDR